MALDGLVRVVLELRGTQRTEPAFAAASDRAVRTDKASAWAVRTDTNADEAQLRSFPAAHCSRTNADSHSHFHSHSHSHCSSHPPSAVPGRAVVADGVGAFAASPC